MSHSDTKEFLEELKEQAKSAESRAENDELTYVDPSDGTVYEWDSDKKGWFPKVFIHLVSQLSVHTSYIHHYFLKFNY